MFKDMQFIEMEIEKTIDEFEKSLKEWNERVIYVVDKSGKVVGCFDKKELKLSKVERDVIYNRNYKYIYEGEEERAKDIFMAYKTIKEIPVLDDTGKILYCYRRDGKEEMEAVIDELRSRGVSVGNDVHIYSSNIDARFGWLISIGNHVTISCATILSHDASMRKGMGYTKLGKVEIGDNCFIGYGSIILPDVKIGNRVIVGAGTVVAKDIPDNSVVIGNPMRIIGTHDEYIDKHERLIKDTLQLPDDRGLNMSEKKRMSEEMASVAYFQF